MGLNGNTEFMGIQRENKLSLLLTPSGLAPPSPEVIITEGLTPLLYLYKPRFWVGDDRIPNTQQRTFALEETERGSGRTEQVPGVLIG